MQNITIKINVQRSLLFCVTYRVAPKTEATLFNCAQL